MTTLVYRAAGALVPTSFESFASLIASTYQDLISKGAIVPAAEPDVPVIPANFGNAVKVFSLLSPILLQ